LAVRFGEEFTRVQYNVLVLGAHLWLVALVASGMGHIGWLLPVVSLPLTLRQIRVVKLADGAALNPQLGATARLGLVFSALLSLGVML
jgi:1,4-dihydroxy-2-naphthoate octaprenyltransferase